MNSLKEVLHFCRDYKAIQQDELWGSQRNLTIQWCNDFRMPTEFKLIPNK
jgi:hypothetical protein